MKNKKVKTMMAGLWMLMMVVVIAGCSKDSLEEVDQLNSAREEMELKSRNNNQNAAQNQLLAQLRRATAKYHNLEVALADGYELDPHCVEHPVYGAMGQHAVNMDRIVPFVVPLEPGVLVYEAKEDGDYKLVAAEYLVPAEPWDAMNDGPPMFGQIEFDDHREIIFVELTDDYGNVVTDDEGNPVMVPVNAKGGPPFPHYQLHVWVWKNNPLGMYFPFNPKVSCEFAQH